MDTGSDDGLAYGEIGHKAVASYGLAGRIAGISKRPEVRHADVASSRPEMEHGSTEDAVGSGMAATTFIGEATEMGFMACWYGRTTETETDAGCTATG